MNVKRSIEKSKFSVSVAKMPKLFSQVVSKIPEELSTKSNRKNEERLLKLNAGKIFHFFFPSIGDHHSIELDSKFWPKDLNYSERLKFANALGSNKKLPLCYDEGTFYAKFIGVTDTEESERQVLTQVENRIDKVSSTEMIDLTFSDLHEELLDNSKSQNCKSQPLQKKRWRHRVVFFWKTKSDRTGAVGIEVNPVRER